MNAIIKQMYKFLLTFLLLVVLVFFNGSFALAVDQEAPEIENVEISEVTETSVTISWTTDEEADSAVNYSLLPDYGIVRIPVAERTTHSITLDDLEPGRVYYFRVVSADDSGNQGISADYKVQTSGTPQTGDADGTGQAEADGSGQGAGASDNSETTPQTQTQSSSETEIVQEIVKKINAIEDPARLEEILNETVKAIEGITEDLTIVGPPTVIPETNTAVVKWTTDRESTSEVLFSPTKSFDGTNYAYSQRSTTGNTTEHEIELIGLSAFTEYSFKVLSTDTYNIDGESRNYTFTTKAMAPDIKNLRVVKVEEDAATLAWDSTVPTKALVEYQNQTTGEQHSVGRPTLATTHQMRLSDLTIGTRYVAFVTAENSGGDRKKSQPIQFITVKDVVPPIISNVTNESTLFSGSESRVQTIIEWDTDEPSSCLVTYQEGMTEGTEPYTIEKELIEYQTKHVEVITDFSPATVYQFYLTCEDEVGNSIKSENFVLFTPSQEKNIIDLIIENFEATFGWVKNITS